MAYIKSKDIQLFPSAFRGQYSSSEGGTVFNPGSRLTTEYNLTSLVSRVSKEHLSYVVRYDKTSTDKNIILSILGYHFALKMSEYLSSDFANASNIWVKIKLEDEAEDNTNTQETKPILKPLNGGTILDEGTETGEFFGIELSETEPSVALGEYKLHILEKTGDEWDVPAKSYFRMSANEISDSADETKSIDEEFNVEKINVEEINVEKINGLTITTAPSAVLTIAEGEELSVNGSVTLAGTGTAIFNKNLTVAGTHNMTLETAGADRILKVSGSNKELAGAGTSLTIDNSLDIAGTTGQITLGTNSHTLAFTTTNNTEVTLPTSGTLYGTKENSISSSALAESVSDETGSGSLVFATSPSLTTPSLGDATATTINNLTLTAESTGFQVSGGEAPKTLILGANTTINEVLNLTSNATQIGSRTLGTSVKPVYLNAGEVTACVKDFIGMTRVSYSSSTLVDGTTLDIQNYVNSASESPLVIKGYVRGQAQPSSVFKLFIGDIEICSFSPGPSSNPNSVVVSFEIFIHSYSITGGFARMISSQSRFVPDGAGVETPCNVFDFPIPSGYTRFEIPIKVEGARFIGGGSWDVSAKLLILTA